MDTRLYEGYYRDFIEKTPYMILVADENGILFHVNEAWKRVLGYQFDDEMNLSLWQFVHPYSRTLCQDNFSQANPGECFDLEVVFTAFDHSLVFTEGKFNCSYDAVNQIKIITGIVQDVTLQNQQALEMEHIKYRFDEKNKYYDMLRKAYVSLINEDIKHFNDNIVSVLKHFGRMVYADRAFIMEFNFEDMVCTNTLEWCNRGILPKKKKFVNIPFSEMEEWIDANVAGDFYYMQDVLSMPKESALRKLLQQHKIMSMIAAPMMKDGKCLGCVGFDSVKVYRTEADDEKQVLSDLGNLFLYAIRRRKKYVDLHDKETRYLSYLENAPIAIAVCDDKGKIHEANLAACKFTGYSQKELVGKKMKILFQADLNMHLDNCIHQDKNTQCSAELQTKSGESVLCTVSFSKANDSEAILLFTESREAER